MSDKPTLQEIDNAVDEAKKSIDAAIHLSSSVRHNAELHDAWRIVFQYQRELRGQMEKS